MWNVHILAVLVSEGKTGKDGCPFQNWNKTRNLCGKFAIPSGPVFLIWVTSVQNRCYWRVRGQWKPTPFLVPEILEQRDSGAEIYFLRSILAPGFLCHIITFIPASQSIAESESVPVFTGWLPKSVLLASVGISLWARIRQNNKSSRRSDISWQGKESEGEKKVAILLLSLSFIWSATVNLGKNCYLFLQEVHSICLIFLLEHRIKKLYNSPNRYKIQLNQARNEQCR